MRLHDIDALQNLWLITLCKEGYELGLIDEDYLIRVVKSGLNLMNIPIKEDTHEDHPVVET